MCVWFIYCVHAGLWDVNIKLRYCYIIMPSAEGSQCCNFWNFTSGLDARQIFLSVLQDDVGLDGILHMYLLAFLCVQIYPRPSRLNAERWSWKKMSGIKSCIDECLNVSFFTDRSFFCVEVFEDINLKMIRRHEVMPILSDISHDFKYLSIYEPQLPILWSRGQTEPWIKAVAISEP